VFGECINAPWLPEKRKVDTPALPCVSHLSMQISVVQWSEQTKSTCCFALADLVTKSVSQRNEGVRQMLCSNSNPPFRLSP